MIIDHQAHWYPRSYLDSIAGRSRYPRTTKLDGGRYLFELGEHPSAFRMELPPHFTDLDQQIAAMDAVGIDAAVLSPNLVGEVAQLELDQAREAIAHINAEMAGAQGRYPGRVIGLGMLPMQDADAAIEALDEVVRLGLRGVMILSNIAGRSIAEEQTWPIYERIEELGLPIFLHPANNSMTYDRGLPYMVDWTAGWMWDSTAAALSLIVSGLLDRCERLEVVHPHLGGFIPYVLGRVSRHAGERRKEPLRHTVPEYLRTRFYTDTVGMTPGALAMASDVYGPDRMLFATDYPWQDHTQRRTFIEDNLSPQALHGVLRENRVASLRLADDAPDGAVS